uniref:Uncharacterized protein n=1 Tax=Chloropicon primus TaxID=1764295 RepID=A0A7S2SWH4_9CHLO
MAAALDNENPLVRERETVVRRKDEGANRGALLGNYLGDGAYAATLQEEEGSDEREPIDSIEVFEHIRDIADPGKQGKEGEGSLLVETGPSPRLRTTTTFCSQRRGLEADGALCFSVSLSLFAVLLRSSRWTRAPVLPGAVGDRVARGHQGGRREGRHRRLLHADRGALLHGDFDRFVHTGKDHASVAVKIQG